MVRYGYRVRQAKGLGNRTAGTHVVGTGRKRSAAVCHPGTATRRRHYLRKLRKRRPGNTAGAHFARGDSEKHRLGAIWMTTDSLPAAADAAHLTELPAAIRNYRRARG